MDEIVINLDQYQKITKSGRFFNTIIGSAMTIVAGVVIIVKTIAGDSYWNQFIFNLMFIFGLHMLFYTFGVYFRIKRRYIVLNNNKIEYKLSYFYPPRTINWKDVRKVEIKTLRVYFHSIKGKVWRMKLGEILYNDIKALKRNLAKICDQNQITWTDSTVEPGHTGS
jgi:energy-coupling factor transporter transmembrane protein EcfT